MSYAGQISGISTETIREGLDGIVRRDAAFRIILGVSFLVCFSPLKLAAYFAPFICIALLAVLAPEIIRWGTAVIFLAGFVTVAMFYNIIYPFFSWFTALISVLTYSSIAFMLVTRNVYLSHHTTDRIMKWLQVLLLIELPITIVQYGIGMAKTGRIGSGFVADHVEGTIGLLSDAGQGDTKMFSANMVLIFLFLLPHLVTRYQSMLRYAGISLLIHLMTSTIHQTFGMIIALAGAFLIVRPNLLSNKKIATLVAWIALFVSFAGLILLTVHSTSTGTVFSKLERIEEGGNPKFMFMARMTTQVPEDFPLFSYFGFGPGQLASRANLIGSGMYFGSPANPRGLPFFDEVVTVPLDRYLLDLWIYFINANISGSSHAPFSSWIALYAEFGIAGWLIVLSVLTIIVVFTNASAKTPEARLFAFSYTASVIFLFIIGFQLMYWEIPQAIFVGLLLMRVNRNQLVHHAG